MYLCEQGVLMTTPTPMPDVDLSTLFLHIPIERYHRSIVLAWILATRNNVPAPILVIDGSPHSSKTATIARLNTLVSPTNVQRDIPSGWYELMIAFAQSYNAVAFDNISPTLSQSTKQHLVQLLFGVTMTSYDQSSTIQANVILTGQTSLDGMFKRGMSHTITCLGGELTSDDVWAEELPGILWSLLELDARVATLGQLEVSVSPTFTLMLDFCRILAAVDQILGTHGFDAYTDQI